MGTMWSGDQTETEIPLPNVRGSILKKVIKYMQYHHTNPAKEIEKPLKSANMREVVSEWDANFVEVDQETLFELILAANYMDINPLLDLTCAKVASMIKGKTPEEIRKRFNIQNDFSPGGGGRARRKQMGRGQLSSTNQKIVRTL